MVLKVNWVTEVAGDTFGGDLLQVLWPFLRRNEPQELQEMLVEAISCKSCRRLGGQVSQEVILMPNWAARIAGNACGDHLVRVLSAS